MRSQIHQNQQRSGQRCTEPKPAPHVDIFRIHLVGVRRGESDGLQRHATFGTRSRSNLPNLGMHRAGVFDAGSGDLRIHRLGWRARMQILLRIGLELSGTTFRAEVVSLALVSRTARCMPRVDGHAAHRIQRSGGLLENREHMATSRVTGLGNRSGSGPVIASRHPLIAFLQTLELALAESCAVGRIPDQKPENR